MQTKVAALAQLLMMSEKTVVYSGAGLSAAAGIGTLAGKNAASLKQSRRTTDAVPTCTHHALSALRRMGLLHGWVQQNHDGLPQKAGFPQEAINEVHGSWFDPSNPVVKFDGMLKQDEGQKMQFEAGTADLVLVVGTSLSGLNADSVASSCAWRSMSGRNSLGMVIINLQQTEQDGKASLRVLGKTDLVLLRLLRKLGVPEPSMRPDVAHGNMKGT